MAVTGRAGSGRRVLGRLAARLPALLGVADQVVASATTLLVGVLVARQGGPALYAELAVGLVAVALSNSVLDSVVYSPFVLRYDGRRLGAATSVALAHQVPFSVLMAVVAGAAAFMIGGAAGASLAPVAGALLLLPLRELARRVSLGARMPAAAFAVDLAFLLLAVAAVEAWLTLAGPSRQAWWHGGTAIGIMGLCSLAAFGCWAGALRPGLRLQPGTFTGELRESFGIWRWMLPSAVLWFVSAQMQPWLIATLGDGRQTAVFAAGFSLSQILNTLVTGVGNLALPGMRDAYRDRGFAGGLRAGLRSGGLLCGACLLLSAVLTLWSDEIVRLVYGPSFAVPRVTVGVLCLNVCAGAVILFVSRFLLMVGWGRFDLMGNVCGALLLPATALLLIPGYGATGAAVSLTLANGAIAAWLLVGLARARRGA